MIDSKMINLEFPVEIWHETHEGKEYWGLASTEETDKFLDIPIIVQGDSEEDVKDKYWEMVKCHNEYMEERSRELDKWKPFQKGQWNHIGGTWIIIFGIHIYFRRGKGMKGGWYIPFTNLNISIHNHWRTKKPK